MGARHLVNNNNSPSGSLLDSKILATELVSSLSRQVTQASSSSNHNLPVMRRNNTELAMRRSSPSSRNRLALGNSKAFSLNLQGSLDNNNDCSLKRPDIHLSMEDTKHNLFSSSSLSSHHSLHNRRNSNLCSSSRQAHLPLQH